MSETGELAVLPTDCRIMHVLVESSSVVTAVAREAIIGHLRHGYRVAVAARQSILNRLEIPTDLAADLLVTVPIPALNALTPADPHNAFTLHKYYRHVDVVHAHGLHAGALAGLGMTGLPFRHRPALVATVGRYQTASVIDAASAEIVGRTAAVVLGTTEPVAERFVDKVPVVERASLPEPDVKTVYEPRRDRAHTRQDLGVPAGTWVIASAIKLADHTALATVLDAAVQIKRKRPDRRTVFVLSGSGRDRETVRDAFERRKLGVLVADEIDTVDVLSAADVVVASEKMSGIDAEGIMQLARPVVFIGTDRGHRPWGDAAVHVAENDTEALLAEINQLLDSPAERGTAAIAVKRRVADVDPSDMRAEDLLHLYALALEHRR